MASGCACSAWRHAATSRQPSRVRRSARCSRRAERPRRATPPATLKRRSTGDRRQPPRCGGEDGQGHRGRQGGLRDHPHRTREPRDVRQGAGRVLRHAHATAAARVVQHAGASQHPHLAVRHDVNGGDRAGHPGLRPGREPEQRRQDDPGGAPAADRGATPGVHQARAPQGRGGPRVGAQRSSSCQGGARPDRPPHRRGRGRRAARREGAGSADQAPRRVRRPVVGAQGERAPRGLMTQPSSIDVLARAGAGRAGRDLPIAIAVGLGLLGLVAVSLSFRKEGFILLALVACGAGLWELAQALTRRGIHIPLLPLLVGTAGILVSSYTGGPEALLVAFMLTAGVLAGRHPLAPSVSPKKTWEGLGGSLLLASSVGAVGMALAFDANPLIGIALGLASVLTATLGDLAESLIKRDLELKDMGSLLPGHGGVLDRIDSLLLSAPLVYLVLLVTVPGA